MATGEKDTFDALCTKLENTCDENGLVYTLQRDRYPFALTVTSNRVDNGQTTLFPEKPEEDSKIYFLFVGGRLCYKTAGGFTLPETTFNKLKNFAKKLYLASLAMFFRDCMTQQHFVDDDLVALAGGDDAGDEEDDAESAEE